MKFQAGDIVRVNEQYGLPGVLDIGLKDRTGIVTSTILGPFNKITVRFTVIGMPYSASLCEDFLDLETDPKRLADVHRR